MDDDSYRWVGRYRKEGSNSRSRSDRWSWGESNPKSSNRITTPDPEPVDGKDDPDPKDEDASAEQGESGGRVGLLVSSNCEYLIQEFLSYKGEHVGTTQATDHALDALRYGCQGVAGGKSGDGRTRIYSDIGGW